MSPRSRGNHNFAYIVMAAGESKRLGQPKQLVEYRGDTLLSQQIKRCLELSSNVYCLLGCRADECISTVKGLPVKTLINKQWQAGLGASIASAVSQMPKHIEAVMLVLVDQWALTTADLNALFTAWQNNPSSIITCYSEKELALSPPIIFSKCYFKELKTLAGESGAKRVLQAHKEKVVKVTIENAFFDLDTPEQLANLPWLSD